MKEEYHLHENVPRQLQQSPVSGHKKRHGCLTTYLITLFTLGLFNLWILYGSLQSIEAMPVWQRLFILISNVSAFIWIIALFKWRKWGFWGWCFTVVSGIIYSLVDGDSIVGAFYPLVGLGILYGVLQIGGENKGWNQLEGFGTTKILEAEDLEMTEQVDYHLQQIATAKEAKTSAEGVKVKIWSEEVLSGGIAGFTGVLISSCAAALALDWNSIDSGAAYIFWILTCLGYPLIGAFLGGVSGFYTSLFLYRKYNADIYDGFGIISSLFVGFIVGLLAGIAPYILLFAWYGLDEAVRDISRASPSCLQVWWQN
jgi:hypothetical protein